MKRQEWILVCIATMLFNPLGITGSASYGNTALVLYKKYLLSSKLLEANNVEEFSPLSILTCASLVAAKGWPTLMCFKNEVCSLYDVLVYKDSPDEGGDVPCWTTINSNYQVECQHPFIEISDVGSECVYISQEMMIFDDALLRCYEMGSYLLVPDNFESLQQYLLDAANGSDFWVGVRDRKWLDGRDVANSEWLVGQPDGAEDLCGQMKRDGGTFGLADKPCSFTYNFICSL